jgi:tetratricopeptide (TPR) repeat protein
VQRLDLLDQQEDCLPRRSQLLVLDSGEALSPAPQLIELVFVKATGQNFLPPVGPGSYSAPEDPTAPSRRNEAPTVGVGTMEQRGCNSLWDLLRADSGEAERARRRLGVGLALAVLLSGLLTALGLAIVVLGMCLFVVALLGTIAAARAVSRNRRRLQQSAHGLVTSLSRISSRQSRRLGVLVRTRASSLARTAVSRTSHLHGVVEGWIVRSAEQIRRTRAAVQLKPIDVQREALRLNSAGTRQRRNGAPAAAIELHTRALELLRETHDLRAVALTQNNLALALSHVGDDRAATALFEQAAATARELGDREHEGRIMANLALAHRRHGRLEQYEDILRIALTKLRRDSTAYKRVEAELSGGT